MKSLESLKELLEDEVKKIAKKGDISPQELDSVYKAVDVIKDITTIEAMKKAEEQDSMMSQQSNASGNSYNYGGGQSNNSNNYGGNQSNNYNQSNGYNSNTGNSMNQSNNQSMNQSNGYMMPYYPMTYTGAVWNRDQMDMMGGSNARGSYGSYNSYEQSNARQGRDGDGDGRYSEDNSYRRGRDAHGRYTSRDSYDYSRDYSRHTEKERMLSKLETMMDEATTDKDRRAIQQCMDKLEG